jgi:hypothetical protein
MLAAVCAARTEEADDTRTVTHILQGGEEILLNLGGHKLQPFTRFSRLLGF